jgi:heme exporter protein A
MLTLENIGFETNDKIIFKNLSITIGLSSSLIISGKNGCGKSSLLKIIAGIYEINHGKILWNNQDIKNFRDDFNGDLQYLGHKNFLKPDLTILENLNFYAKLSDTKIAVDSALEFFDLNLHRHELVKNLSAGWQQRIMLAKLLACPSTIWLLDEPSINLDKENKQKLKELIKIRIKDQGIVIMVSHDEEFFDLGPKIMLEDFAS